MTGKVYSRYEAVIGLEVHAQLSTQSKAFSTDPAAFGGLPNTHVSPVSLGHPGTLPVVNEKLLEYAVKMGLATHCSIRKESFFARKNYFYADLPKGYQITQDTMPVCYDGFIRISLKDGSHKQLRIHRIHMEEDAGKSMHDQDQHNSLIDLNRAGVPLIEIVSEPDIRSGEEAGLYLAEVRRILRYLEICDGNMEEGSMRCDANISVRLKGEARLGTRCEVKNLNSIRNVQRAIDFEARRQIDILESGGSIEQHTLNFDPDSGETTPLRAKETANDYRYFPEPDMPPLLLTEEYIQEIRATLPMLPEEWQQKLINEYSLPEYDAQVLTESKRMVLYFESMTAETRNYKAAANWLMGPVKSFLNEEGLGMAGFPVPAASLAGLINLIDEGKLNYSVAAQTVFPAMLKDTSAGPASLIEKLGVGIDNSADQLTGFIEEVIARYPDKVKQYQSGKKGLIGMFMGEVMKLSKGKIDPKAANRLMAEKLEKA
ncbi:aspartyl/glutamyl-tRNA(Asn/Gln) amidotransferase subunit B [Anseongella ginsenosidimutans]|uniref:Aspartyl/glutamyl-tRNA(Asn/Gln) amidotransferase subunit B n=1 Tax=Anseongella ginsenosidimutans TaxID=496056 RepID=A0A4R3KSW4_9SPHI|nr:Asp-tRNA(Asn)/Glu-tRNA(Gln) amidotransferase subunit GatB [Anseongella ginsenosidimutans]QEC52938.1 Asp-tRNA(Asn)/Glu-tRNA(Gln) amidotransferase subunit GatB [Anseongella ginsenosidimutans]TCS87333.1 aspartyl/glutamyl-tRNA(Asn/Gln) amidotransferase subunit B [Anseongella ginsenosidimutans]